MQHNIPIDESLTDSHYAIARLFLMIYFPEVVAVIDWSKPFYLLKGPPPGLGGQRPKSRKIRYGWMLAYLHDGRREYLKVNLGGVLHELRKGRMGKHSS